MSQLSTYQEAESILPKNDNISPGDEMVKILLSRRFLLGIPPTALKKMVTARPDELIETLLKPPTEPVAPPIKDYVALGAHSPDSEIGLNETWVHHVSFDSTVNYKRKLSLKNWIASLLMGDDFSLRPRMFYFWSEFFGIDISQVGIANDCYIHYNILYSHALENYKDILLQVILDNSLKQVAKRNRAAHQTIQNRIAEITLKKFIFGESYSEILSLDKQKKFLRYINEWNTIVEKQALSSRSANNAVCINPIVLDKPAIKEFIAEFDHLLSGILKHEKASFHLAMTFLEFLFPLDPASKYRRILTEETATTLSASQFDIKSMLRHLWGNSLVTCLVAEAPSLKSPVEFLSGLFVDFRLQKFNKEDHIVNYQIWDMANNMLENLGQPIGKSFHLNDPNQSMVNKQKTWLSEDHQRKRKMLIHILCGKGFPIDQKTVLKLDSSKFINYSRKAFPALTQEQIVPLILLSQSFPYELHAGSSSIYSDPDFPHMDKKGSSDDFLRNILLHPLYNFH